MDGRCKRLLASGILFGVIGCSSVGDKKPALPRNTAEPPLSSVSAKAPAEKRNDGPVKVETLLAFANVHLEAATMPDRSQKDRDVCLSAAREKYQEILKRDPKNLDAILGMAHSYKISEEKSLCVDWYQRAAKAYPKNAAIVGEMGQSLDALKDRDAAINAYHLATKMDPNNKNYCKALGFSLARAGRYEEAYAWLSRCMNPADAHMCLGQMMDHNGQKQLADQQYAEVLKLNPASETARLALHNPPPPDDGIPLATPIQTVSYQQMAPVANAPQQTAPITNAPTTSTPAFVAAPQNVVAPLATSGAIRPPEPLPLFMNRPSPPPSTAVQGWMMPR